MASRRSVDDVGLRTRSTGADEWRGNEGKQDEGKLVDRIVTSQGSEIGFCLMLLE